MTIEALRYGLLCYRGTSLSVAKDERKGMGVLRQDPLDGKKDLESNRTEVRYDSSNPWELNLRVRQFSVTVRTTLSGAPSGISASISTVTLTLAPTKLAMCWTTASAIVPASRAIRVGSSATDPWNRLRRGAETGVGVEAVWVPGLPEASAGLGSETV